MRNATLPNILSWPAACTLSVRDASVRAVICVVQVTQPVPICPLQSSFEVHHVASPSLLWTATVIRVQPWQTLVTVSNHSTFTPFSLMILLLSLCKLWLMIIMLSGIPCCLRNYHSEGRCMQSKAFSESIKFIIISLCRTVAFSVVCLSFNMWSLCGLPGLNLLVPAVSTSVLHAFRQSAQPCTCRHSAWHCLLSSWSPTNYCSQTSRLF